MMHSFRVSTKGNKEKEEEEEEEEVKEVKTTKPRSLNRYWTADSRTPVGGRRLKVPADTSRVAADRK